MSIGKITIRLVCGRIEAVFDAEGRPIDDFDLEECGPSPWANCESCCLLYPADDIDENENGAWLCYKCSRGDDP